MDDRLTGFLSLSAVVLVAGRPVDSAHSAHLSTVLWNTVTATPSGHRIFPLHWQKFMSPSEVFR